MPICWFESYTFLSYFSIAGISVALVGMVCIFGFCINLFLTDQYEHTPINLFNFSGMVGHIGVAMFVFEGNAVIMNVRAETKNQKAYPTILRSAIIFTVLLFMTFATICYLTYRDLT
jgi:amino acid permease